LLVVKHYADRFNLVEYFNGLVEWDKTQWKISPGNLALSLIYACFMSVDGRIPLYKISDRLQGLDLTLLFGFPFEPEDFNDDLYARFLDRLGKTGRADILHALIRQIYSIFKMPQSKNLHADTTSQVMFGQYKDCDEKGYKGLRVAKGYSKVNDRKHKQILSGVIVDGNGVLWKAEALDGNMSDAVWNNNSIKELRKELGDNIDQVFYVADSKLVTQPNLDEVNKGTKPLKIISLVPASFHKKISSEIRKKAYEEGFFEDVGSCCQDTGAKDRARYSISSTTADIVDRKYRLLVCISSSLSHNSDEQIYAKYDDLKIAAETIFSKPFACEPDAKKAIARFQKTVKNALFKVGFNIIRIEKEKPSPGPKPKNPRPLQMVTEFQVQINEIVRIIEKIEQFKRQKESFVLITNIPETDLSDREVLCIYKSQGVVERTFSRLKRPIMVDPLFLKSPLRIDALMSLVYIALMFQGIMQAMARHRENILEKLPKIKYAKRDLENPTYELLENLLAPFEVISSNGLTEFSCLVPEMEEHLMLILFLIDAETC
jgi:transposase